MWTKRTKWIWIDYYGGDDDELAIAYSCKTQERSKYFLFYIKMHLLISNIVIASWHIYVCMYIIIYKIVYVYLATSTLEEEEVVVMFHFF